MQEAKDHFVEVVSNDVKSVNVNSIIPATVIESTSMVSYEGECGIGFPTTEMWPGGETLSMLHTSHAYFKLTKSYNITS